MKKIKAVHVLMMMVLTALLLAGCGSGSPAPRGATITLTKDKLDFKGLGTCPATPVWSYDPITITVVGSNGAPIAGIEVNYSVGFSTETTGPSPNLDLQRIYSVPPAGPTGGPPPPEDRLLGAGVLKTDAGGKIQIILGTDMDCPHTVDFSVESGSSSAKTTITVT